MTIKVYFFGYLAEKTGQSYGEFPLPANVEELLVMVQDRFPAISQTAWVIAINRTVVHDRQHPLANGDEVAMMPPFAGG